ncbi:MAG: nucleoside-diphosphate kinase [Patescibacteria group bacterium]
MSPKSEKVLIIMKPDCIQRSLLGEILHRFERKGLQIIGMKMTELGDVVLKEHYLHHSDKPFFVGLSNYMKSAPVVLVALSGVRAVSAVRMIVGPTRGHEAPAGTIRGDFSLSSQTNIVHASDSSENAEIEIKRFFEPDELFNYTKPEYPFMYAEDERN